MSNWIECKITFRKDGKKVTENYLVDAMSFTEAEAVATDEARVCHENFQIGSVAKRKFDDVLETGADFFYKVKFSFADIDEKTGKEKKVSNYLLSNGENLNDALGVAIETLGQLMVSCEVESISLTKITKIIHHKK